MNQKDGELDWVSYEVMNRKLADEYAVLGSVKHFALRLGFMPHDEKEAEKILKDVIEESERYQTLYEQYKTKCEMLQDQLDSQS